MLHHMLAYAGTSYKTQADSDICKHMLAYAGQFVWQPAHEPHMTKMQVSVGVASCQHMLP